MPQETTSVEIAATQFWAAHEDSLFKQTDLVEVTGLTCAWFERARWEGRGPRFLKLGRLVRYRKSNVLAWLNQHQTVASTSEAGREPAPRIA